MKLFRLSAAGAKVLDDALGGSLDSPSAAKAELLTRLEDAGAIHPVPRPGAGPWDASDVTIVVPVLDDQPNLERLIERIWETSPGVAGVIVVDDGSAVPLRVEPPLPGREAGRVTILRRDSSGGPGVARNDGLAKVETALVAFLDVDCEPTPDWLQPLLAHFADTTVVAAAPRVVAIPRAEPATNAPRSGGIPDHGRLAQKLLAKLFDYELTHSPLDLGDEPARVSPGTRVSYVPTAALLARVDTLRSAGGFDPSLIVGEDVDLVWRLVEGGSRVRFEPGSKVGHQVRGSYREWLKQRFVYGTSAALLAQRHGSSVSPVNVSPWSLAVWALVCVGYPATATGVAIATTWRLRVKIPDVDVAEVVRLGVGGHLGAGQQLARATVRVWWPAALLGSLFSRRIRNISIAAVMAAGLTGTARSPIGIALSLVDDMAYGAGVWRGCIATRSPTALLPTVNRARTTI